MANNSPTLITASLSDDQLKKSINSLVAHVDEAMKKMVQSTNNAVGEMEAKLKSLGNLKIGSGGTNDGGASKRTKAQNEETEAIEKNIAARDRQIKKNQEAAMTFDRMQTAIAKATRFPSEMRMDSPKSARESFYAFQSALTTRVRELTAEIKSAEAAFDSALDTKLQAKQFEWQQKLEQTKRKLEQFRANVGENPSVQQMREEQRIINLMNQQQSMLDKIRGQRTQMLQPLMALQKEEQKVVSMMHDIEQGQSKVAQSTQQTTQSAQHYTEEIHKQISAIAGRKDATKAFEQISLMPSNTMDEIKAKGQALVELVKKVKDTPLMSQSNVKLAEKMIGSLANQYRALKEEKEKVANTATTNAAAENTTRRSFEQEKQDLERLKTLQEERRQQIIQTGIAAQQQAQNLRESIGQQLQAADYTKQVDNVKELQNALTEMKNAYKQPIDSSIKKSLEEDIAKTEKALDIAKRYNMTVAGMGAVGVGGKAPTDTLAAYSAEAQRLAGIYKTLSTEERNASAGQGLKRKYQELSLTASQVRKELERPINLKEAMKGGENTIDELAHKIQRLQSYKRGINITDPKQAGELEQVDAKINQLTKDLNKYMSTTKRVSEVNNALSRSWNYMKNRLAFYFSVQASRQFLMELVRVRSEYEMNERALGILIGSAERGTQVFQELSQMSLVSPYTLIELSAAAKQLTAYDIAARDVVDTTRRLADMASAVGVPIERLTYALGQIKAYGYLNSRDQRMFANAGIPLAGELAKYYTEIEGRLVSTGDVYDRIKKKAVDYNDVMQVMYRMTDEGGKFFDFQAKMADTLKVRIANLTLAWNNMMNDIGKSQQGVLTSGIRGLTVLFRHWQDFAATLRNVAIGFGLAKAAQILYASYTQKVGLATAFADASSKKLVGTMYSLKAGITSLITSPMTWWILLATAVTSAGMAFYDANQKLKEFNNTLRQGGEENFKNINDFLGQYQDLRKGLGETNAKGEAVSPIKDISNDEAKKAWEAMREQIELSTAASGTYLQSLMSIENVSERLRVGFKLLDDIQQVNAAMKDLESTELEVSQSYSSWWNLWTLQDGMIENIKEYSDEVQHVTHGWENFGKQAVRSLVPVAGSLYNIYENFNSISNKLSQAKEDIDDFAQSINKFINREGLTGNPTGVIEAYAQAMKKATAEANLSPEQAFIAQKLIEAERSKVVREALKIRIADENAALAQARDENAKADINERLKVLEAQQAMFNKSLDATRPYWDDFNKYIKERHLSEIEQMFRGAETEQERSIILQSAKWDKAVDKWVREYAKSHKMSYDEAFGYLRQWVKTADMWKITIPLIISTEGAKSVLDTLKEADQVINDAYSGIERLKKRRDELKKQGASLLGTTDKDREYAKILKEIADKEKEYADAKAKGGISSKEEKADAKAAKAAAAARKKEAAAAAKAEREAESELAKALGNEIQLINEAKSEYKKLEDAGYETFSALEIIQKRFSQSVKNINAVLAKNNIPLFDLSRFTGASNPRFLLNMLEEQIKALKNNPRVKAGETQKFEIEFSKVDIDAKAYDSKKIAEGLDNSLSRLKDEYELAIALDADPELGNLFADWMGIDTSVLPRTVQEYAERATKYLNQYLKENKAELTIPDILNLTSDDIRAFEEGTKTGLYNKEWVERIKKTYEDAANYRKKDMEDAVKQWNNLIQKYGDLQDQLTKIEKDAMVEQAEVIKQFGSEDQKRRVVDITRMISITKDPEELARLTAELLTLLQAVTEKSQKGVSVTKAISNEKEQKTSKAYWEDFKNSNLYALTFDDMANNSTRAIQLIITKLNELKDKVKEDPASMKALMDSLQKAEEELNARNPFKAVIDGLKEWYRATKDVKRAELELKVAQQQQTILQNAYNKALKEGDPVKIAAAQEHLATATQRVKNAEEGLVNAENKAQKGLNKFQTNLSNTAQYLQQVSDGITAVEDIMKTLGADEDTVEFIKAINSGFQKMITILMAVAAAITVIIVLRTMLNTVAPELFIISAALAVIIGMIQYLDSHKNNKINKEVKKSEREVKRLETAYKNLEVAIDEAYGTMVVGAKQAAIANKELQLAELRRQLQLEQSRKKKHRDADKIQDLKSQIIDLQNDIRKSYQEIATELLGFSDVGDAAEDMIGTFIDNLRSGEDAMASFTTSVKDMIANLVKNMIVTKVIGPELEAIVDDMNERIRQRSTSEAKAYEQAVERQTKAASLSDSEIRNEIIKRRAYQYSQDLLAQGYGKVAAGMWAREMAIRQEITDADIQALQDEYTQAVKEAKKELDKKTTPTLADIDLVAKSAYDLVPTLEGWEGRINEILKRYDLFKDTSDKQLSALQQGLQSMSESTAESLEAYMNGVSQQVYYHSSLLEQIRDSVVGLDLDVSLGVQSQMLLQLQSSYQTQQAIQQILEGVLNPSGRAFSVELIS